jgi:hypothetical protein
LAIGIASYWLVPYLDPSFQGLALNINNGNLILPALILTLVIGKVITDRKNPFSQIDILLMVAGFLSLIPDHLAVSIRSLGINGLHLYRYQYYLFLFGPISLIPYYLHHKVYQTKNFILLSSCAIALIIFLDPLTVQNTKFLFNDQAISQLSGRIMNAANYNAIPNNPHLLEHYLINHNPRLFGAIGLFYESSSRGLQFYELANQLEPNAFKNGSFKFFFTDESGNPLNYFDASATAQLLGVTNAIYVDKPSSASRSSDLVIGQVNQKDEPFLDIKSHSFPKVNLAEALSVIPPTNSKINIGTWWLDTNHSQLYLKDQIPPSELSGLNLQLPSVTLTGANPTTIRLFINSQQPTPVVVKFTYNKYWRAKPLDSHSQTTQPYWITPGNMLLIGHGNLELNWVQPPYYRLTLILSFLCIFVCLISLLRRPNPYAP